MNIVISSLDPPIVSVTKPGRSAIGVRTPSRQSVYTSVPMRQTIDILMNEPTGLTVIGLPGEPGPPGPEGPQGPPGSSEGGFFRFIQSGPTAVWYIVHSLGYYPNVTVVDSAHQAVIPEVNYTSPSELVLTFSAEVAGEAYLS